MKKTIFTFVMAAILLCSMAVCASALEDYTATKDANDNYSYTITYNVGAANKGEMYGMVAVTGVTNTDEPVINESNIVYIDQATADEAGNITFTKFAPMGKTPAETGYAESLVCIGGKGLDGATAIGTLKAVTTGGGDEGGDDPAPTTYKITGTVKDTKSKALATITVKNDTAEKTATADATGAYSIDVDAGTYSVIISKPGYCTFTYTNVVVDGAKTLKEADISKLVGDVNDTNEVNGEDLTNLLSDFPKDSSSWRYTSDVNASGEVNGEDLTTLLYGFGSFSKTSAAEYAN